MKKYTPNEGASLIAVTVSPLYNPSTPSVLTMSMAHLNVEVGTAILALEVVDGAAIVVPSICILTLTRSAGTRTIHCARPPNMPANKMLPGDAISPFLSVGSKNFSARLSPAKDRLFMKNCAKRGAVRPL